MNNQRVVPKLKQQAGIEQNHLTDPSICPACRTRMVQVLANGHRAYCCLNDRVVLPVPNTPTR